MKDLAAGAASAGRRRRCCDPIPSPVPCLLLPLFLAGLAVSLFILVVVHNAFSLAFLLVLSAPVVGFVVWNLYNFRNNGALFLFLDRMPASNLRNANDGEIVKITGIVSCGELALVSSYEKIERCIYSSTLLYEYRGFGSQIRDADSLCFRWNLTYVERCIADFFVTDTKSSVRVLVKAGYGSNIYPVVTETQIVDVSSKKRELSRTLKNWLEGRHLSAEPRLLRLKEGYMKEGSSLTVMGMLSRKNGVLMVVPPPEPLTTGCTLRKFLLPIDVDGLVLIYHGDDSVATNQIT